MTTFDQWIKDVTAGASTRDIAERIGDITHPTVARHIKENDVRLALNIAKYYDASKIEALLAASAITEQEIRDYAKAKGIGIEDYSDIEVAQIIVYRLEKAAEAGENSELATVTKFPAQSNTLREDVPLDLYIDQAAANSAPEEQEGEPGDYEA